MVKVKGDSMINANINDGNLVVIWQHNTANNHEIVAVDLDGNTIIKRFLSSKLISFTKPTRFGTT